MSHIYPRTCFLTTELRRLCSFYVWLLSFCVWQTLNCSFDSFGFIRIHRTNKSSIFSPWSNCSVSSHIIPALKCIAFTFPPAFHSSPVTCALCTLSLTCACRQMIIHHKTCWLTFIHCVKWHILFSRLQQQIKNNDWQDRDEKTVMRVWLCGLLRRVSCICILILWDSRSMLLLRPKLKVLFFWIVHIKLDWTLYWQVLLVIQKQMKPSQESSRLWASL